MVGLKCFQELVKDVRLSFLTLDYVRVLGRIITLLNFLK